MSRESTDGERNALQRLLEAAQKLVGNFTADVDLELRPVVAEVLAESGLLLTEVIESFGWNGANFTRPVDVQKLISRLKALVYDGLEPMGRGTFASVYKVTQPTRPADCAFHSALGKRKAIPAPMTFPRGCHSIVCTAVGVSYKTSCVRLCRLATD